MNEKFAYYDDEFSVHYTLDEIPVQSGLNMHQHDKYEIYFMIQGTGSFIVDGNIYRLKPDSILIFRPGEKHKARIDKEGPYERIAIHFSPSVIQNVDKNKILLSCFDKRPAGTNNLLIFEDNVFEDINYWLKRMVSAEHSDEMRQLSMRICLYSLLYMFNDYRAPQPLIQNIKKDMQSSIHDIINYIDMNLTNDICLDSICQRFYISKSSLNRRFKSATGSTVWNYVLEKRLLIARNLIDAGSTIQHACKLCGFNDYSSFYRRYKSFFNQNPKKKRS